MSDNFIVPLTGNKQIDEQHQAIFDLLADIELALREGRTLLGVYAFTRLKRQVQEHFLHEETVLKSDGCPDLDQHIAEHAAITEALIKFHLEFVGKDIPSEAIAYLRQCMHKHLTVMDPRLHSRT